MGELLQLLPLFHDMSSSRCKTTLSDRQALSFQTIKNPQFLRNGPIKVYNSVFQRLLRTALLAKEPGTPFACPYVPSYLNAKWGRNDFLEPGGDFSSSRPVGVSQPSAALMSLLGAALILSQLSGLTVISKILLSPRAQEFSGLHIVRQTLVSKNVVGERKKKDTRLIVRSPKTFL